MPTMISAKFPYGSQYYRAPTPEPACWEEDLAHMARLGMNCVKFWVQWRWSHREDGIFRWDDLDRLMDLAQQNRLEVHLNLIADVAPDWLYEHHPDAKPVMADGRVVEPYEVAHRQLGGHPGPCYRHAGALVDRKTFIRAAISHFAPHPALGWFDVWNEPELCFPSRSPDLRTLTCYCATCRRDFVGSLQRRYGTLDRLNEVWGRCYSTWSRIEAPRSGECVQDMIDWRQFQIDTMTDEARWRLEAARELAPRAGRYLHVCSTTLDSWSHTAAAVDNFALADLHDEVFAASTGAWPPQLHQALSAAQGRRFWNTESHINFGMISMHPRILDARLVRAHFLPQIGAGITGYMLWQFRTERLGIEAPAWGMVRADGSSRPGTIAIGEFFAALAPYAELLARCRPQAPRIGLWESPANEVFHFCMHKKLEALSAANRQWHVQLHDGSWPFICINSRQLSSGQLAGLQLLIMPCAYYLTGDQARALDAWVRAGGVLLTEAHFAGYDGDEGRHSRQVPGFGLAESWGVRERDTTAAIHLRLPTEPGAIGTVSPDVQKALQEAGSGSRWFPMRLADGIAGLGCDRVALLEGADLESLAEIPGLGTVAGCLEVGAGAVFYVGTALGEAASRDPRVAEWFLRRAAARAHVSPTAAVLGEQQGVRAEILSEESGAAQAVVLCNRVGQPRSVSVELPFAARGLFTGRVVSAGRQSVEFGAEEADIYFRHQ